MDKDKEPKTRQEKKGKDRAKDKGALRLGSGKGGRAKEANLERDKGRSKDRSQDRSQVKG